MKVQSLVVVASALGALAQPHRYGRRHHAERRAEAIVTVTTNEVDWVTVSSTVYVTAVAETTTAPVITVTAQQHQEQQYTKPTAVPSTSSVPVQPAPVPSSSSSSTVFVAPAPKTSTLTTSKSSYVPPTTSSAPTSTFVLPTTSSTPTSTYVPPAPTSTYITPTTSATSTTASTPTYSPPAIATAAAVTSSAANLSSGSGTTIGMLTTGMEYTGKMTYYTAGSGACGVVNTDADMIVAVSHIVFDAANVDANPNNNPLCRQKISVQTKSGESKTAVITDRCEACSEHDLDLTPGLYQVLGGTTDEGHFQTSWMLLG